MTLDPKHEAQQDTEADVGEREALIRKVAIQYRIPEREVRRLVNQYEDDDDA